jgi:acetylornithine deacetylase/succinyl-diaminopimelate desuccinylase-like protein
VLFYGHLDKQPFGEGWLTDPTEPVIKEGKLYGRGAVDDGYAFFSAITAIKACQATGASHPRCVITIEGSEEGEVQDLIHYMGKYYELLGSPSLVICLDTFAASDKSMSITCSLRGSMTFNVAVATNYMQSGFACTSPF